MRLTKPTMFEFESDPDAALLRRGEQGPTQRQRERAIDCGPHRAGHHRVIAADVVLAIEEVHRSKEVEGRPKGPFSTRRAVLTLDHNARLVAHGPACLT